MGRSKRRIPRTQNVSMGEGMGWSQSFCVQLLATEILECGAIEA